jgi:hypothetical protein
LTAAGRSPTFERQDGGQITQPPRNDIDAGSDFSVQPAKNHLIILLVCAVCLKTSKILAGKKFNFSTG